MTIEIGQNGEFIFNNYSFIEVNRSWLKFNDVSTKKIKNFRKKIFTYEHFLEVINIITELENTFNESYKFIYLRYFLFHNFHTEDCGYKYKTFCINCRSIFKQEYYNKYTIIFADQIKPNYDEYILRNYLRESSTTMITTIVIKLSDVFRRIYKRLKSREIFENYIDNFQVFLNTLYVELHTKLIKKELINDYFEIFDRNTRIHDIFMYFCQVNPTRLYDVYTKINDKINFIKKNGFIDTIYEDKYNPKVHEEYCGICYYDFEEDQILCKFHSDIDHMVCGFCIVSIYNKCPFCRKDICKKF